MASRAALTIEPQRTNARPPIPRYQNGPSVLVGLEIAFTGINVECINKRRKMPKNKSPKKKYVPKPVRPPVTKGLFDEFGRDMHFSLMSFMAGTASVERWKKLAKVIMTVSFATDDEPRVSKAHKTAIDSAVLTLKAISDLNVRTGKWHVSDLDYLSLSRGVTAVDAVLPHLDYRKLRHGYLTFVNLTRQIKEESCS